MPESAATPLSAEYLNMLGCVRCGQCLTACPTFVLTREEAEGPRGRIALARGLAEGTLTLSPDLARHEWTCLVCDACTAACPAGVQMDPLQVSLRATVAAPETLRARFYRWFGLRVILGAMWRLRIVVTLLWIARGLSVDTFARRSGLARLLGLERAMDLVPTSLSDDHLHADGTAHPPVPEVSAPTRVQFFAGCLMSTALAGIDRASIRVLQRAGCAVEVTRGQGCCGALHAHAGDLDAARARFKATIAAFAGSADFVVVNSPGCGAMLRDYAHHLAGDPDWAERARAFSARVVDFTQFMAPRHLRMTRRLDLTVTYQDACHLAHAQRITAEPRRLLRSIPGLALREMAESTLCCGSAGFYNLTHPETATALRERKLDRAASTNAEVIVTTNPGCLLHLQAGLTARGSSTRVRHIAEILDEATAP